MLNKKGHVGLACTFTYSSFCEQTSKLCCLPYITASHQAACINSCQCKSVLLGFGSDVGIIIKGNIVMMFIHRYKYRLTLHGLFI